MTRVLLTGGTGFIGARLLTHLHAAGIGVISVGRSALPDRFQPTIDHRVVPRLDAEQLSQVVNGGQVDAVIHLAAAGINPGDRDHANLRRVNGDLPAECVDVAQAVGARGFLMAGSSSEYARFDGDRIREDAPLETMKLYGATKAAGAIMAVATGAALCLPCVNLRLFNVFGPGEAPHRLCPALRAALQEGREVPLSEGLQVRDFIHVDDACRAILAALSTTLAGSLPTGHYNVCTGQPTSVRSFALDVAAAMNADASLLRFGALPLRPDDQPRVVGDPSLFEAMTGWRPLHTVTTGIAHTLSELSRAERAGTP
ncbi:NAD-dependent epimerase/dehydratase family protein [Luteibacter yeojuensis]